MLTIKNLSFAYGSIQTLNSVDMEMETGKVTCILGRNGVGKTTLLKNIMGILKPSPGSILQIDGVDLTTKSRFGGKPSPMAPHLRAKMGLGYVPQGRQIFPRISVEDNLKVALQARREEMFAQVAGEDECLDWDEFKDLKPFRHKPRWYVASIFRRVDADDDDCISFEEFTSRLTRHGHGHRGHRRWTRDRSPHHEEADRSRRRRWWSSRRH